MADSSAELRAGRAYRRGDYLSAINLYREVAANEPLGKLSLIRLGFCQRVIAEPEEAFESFRAALETPPINDAQSLTGMGCMSEIQGKLAEAKKFYRKATIHPPNESVAAANLAYLLLLESDIPGAYATLAKSMDPTVHISGAELLLPSFDAARLTEVPLADNRAVAALLMLASRLQEVGRFEESLACSRRLLASGRFEAEALLNITSLSKISQDSPELKKLEDLVREPKSSSPSQIALHFAYGKALEDVGRYSEAMGQFETANRLSAERERSGFDRRAFSRSIDAAIRLYPKEFVENWSKQGSRSELPILIVGMMRSGTTLVEQIVSSHPEVAGGDELMFWQRQLQSRLAPGARPISTAEGETIIADYLALLSSIEPDAARVTDKMPLNFYGLGPIHMLFPEARILWCQRDPVDVALSTYKTFFRMSMSFKYRKSDLVFFYREYERLMAHWQEVVPPNRMLPIRYEELLANREEVTRKIIDFCGLEWDDACLHPEQNRRAIKTASVWQARQAAYSGAVKRWKKYEPWLGALRELARED